MNLCVKFLTNSQINIIVKIKYILDCMQTKTFLWKCCELKIITDHT